MSDGTTIEFSILPGEAKFWSAMYAAASAGDHGTRPTLLFQLDFFTASAIDLVASVRAIHRGNAFWILPGI
jgi:hypothetical protein